jgi:hypothetical protein
MKYIAAIVAAASALRFSEMDDVELGREGLFAMTAAQIGSGVRARWVELPDCMNEGPLPAGEVALKNDLSNAVIATCKSYGVVADRWGRVTQYEANPSALASEEVSRDVPKKIWESLGKDAYDKLNIYDPIIREEGATNDSGWPTRYTAGRIPSHEHQVTQQAPGHWEDGNTEHPEQQLGTVEATYSINVNGTEPVGDWQHLTGGGFKYSEEEWEDLPDLVAHNGTAAPGVNDNAKAGPDYSVLQLEDDVLAQTEKRWVELPDCDGSTDEIPLTHNHEWAGVDHNQDGGSPGQPNGTVATCKTRAGVAQTGAADAALDSVTPGF